MTQPAEQSKADHSLMKILPRYTFGMGDRFGLQGEAQLKAILEARSQGIDVYPVWNKSNREHLLIGTKPPSLRIEADRAVEALGFDGPYFVDADHITDSTVDPFVECSDFFTLDVAENLGQAPQNFENRTRYEEALMDLGTIELPGCASSIVFDQDSAHKLVNSYGKAIEAAKDLYQKIANSKETPFAIEISMDETETPQGPKELMAILCLLSLEGIPAQTIAPKFTGRFNKGVDYVGDLTQFEKEFESDLLVISYAVQTFGLPQSLKLSVHSGSDKFSLYPIINRLLKKHQAGLHTKTAGTTWLEEVIGLAEAGDESLEFVKTLYGQALEQLDSLTAPYAPVLNIQKDALPSMDEAQKWTSESVIRLVAHNPDEPLFNLSLRQLFHVSFKLAAQSGDDYLKLVEQNAVTVGNRVYQNLLEKHILPIYPTS
ncbi:MAG: tagaturonate epimerase family protein [Verrucomicrobiota bacterium]